MLKRTLATTLVAMTVLATPGVALAAPPAAPSGPTVTINGKTYGPNEGLEITTVTYSGGRAVASTVNGKSVDPSTVATPTASTGDFTTMGTGDTYRENRGTSYVSSYEASLVEYVGKSYAAGNVASSKRWIKACFRYTRNGKNLVGDVCSTATQSGSTWKPGATNTKTVFDSLGLNDPKTNFTALWTSINPGVS